MREIAVAADIASSLVTRVTLLHAAAITVPVAAWVILTFVG